MLSCVSTKFLGSTKTESLKFIAHSGIRSVLISTIVFLSINLKSTMGLFWSNANCTAYLLQRAGEGRVFPGVLCLLRYKSFPSSSPLSSFWPRRKKIISKSFSHNQFSGSFFNRCNHNGHGNWPKCGKKKTILSSSLIREK